MYINILCLKRNVFVNVNSSWRRLKATDWVLLLLCRWVNWQRWTPSLFEGSHLVAYLLFILFPVLVFVLITCLSFIPSPPPVLQNPYIFAPGIGSKMLILKMWIFTEPLSTMLGVVGTGDTKGRRAFIVLPFDRASLFHRLCQVAGWNNHLINVLDWWLIFIIKE